MKILFDKARFLATALHEEEWPSPKNSQGKPLPEIALVGRSNVGKSSLINHLLGQKRAAKTSATPGKTQRINFFIIDEQLLIVDLPGYGYAEAPIEEVRKWTEAIDTYFTTRKTLRLIVLLIDSRRGPSDDDLKVAEWAQQKRIPLLPILTKTDKLKPAEIAAAAAFAKPLVGEALPYSVHDKDSKRKLIAIIQKKVE